MPKLKNFDIIGTVTEEGTEYPVLGASKVLKGAVNVAVSDFDAIFTINDVPLNGVLVFLIWVIPSKNSPLLREKDFW